jgi:hypothetical protein
VHLEITANIGVTEVKLDALDHPKTLDFAARLQVELPTAIGHLELLWAFTGKKAPQGDVGKWPDGAIARACYWNGDPRLFLSALVAAGFIDTDTDHRYVVHDWHDHAPRWVRSKLVRAGLEIHSSPDGSGDCSPDSSPDRSGDSVSEAKRSEAKSQSARATRLTDDFELTPERRLVAEVEKLPAERTFAKFCDYWRAASGAKARKHDWDATWRNWCRTEADRSRGALGSVNGRSRPEREPTQAEIAEARRKAAAENRRGLERLGLADIGKMP